MTPKTTSIRVRLTENEKQHLETLSIKLQGRINISRLVRKFIRDAIGLGPDLLVQESKQFQIAVRQLTGIARNLNQITAAIHSDKTAEKRLTMDYLKRLEQSTHTLKKELLRFIENTRQRGAKTDGT